jgi:hypothetical protein
VPGLPAESELFIGSCSSHPSLCEVVTPVPDWWIFSALELAELRAGGTISL